MAESDGETLVVVRGMEVLVEREGESVRLCSHAIALEFGEEPVFVGHEGTEAWYAARARENIELPPGVSFSAARPLFAALAETTLHMVGRALACVEFEETHRFCGRCATKTEPGSLRSSSTPAVIERQRICPNCGLSFHPRIPPAVIVLIERGPQLLLARGASFPPGRFSAVAGFVEIGESLEHAAQREVREEVGVEISDLRYFSSQPWPFGHSLMIGFNAQYAGGDLRADGTEIVEAAWFDRDTLPLLPPPISIARKMIDAFLKRN